MTTAQFQAPPGPSASVVHKMPSSSTIRMDDDEDMRLVTSHEEKIQLIRQFRLIQ